jgi:hypothetical protein
MTSLLALSFGDALFGAGPESRTYWKEISGSRQSPFRFDRIETGRQILDLTRFRDANRFPPRIKSGAGFRFENPPAPRNDNIPQKKKDQLSLVQGGDKLSCEQARSRLPRGAGG